MISFILGQAGLFIYFWKPGVWNLFSDKEAISRSFAMILWILAAIYYLSLFASCRFGIFYSTNRYIWYKNRT